LRAVTNEKLAEFHHKLLNLIVERDALADMLVEGPRDWFVKLPIARNSADHVVDWFAIHLVLALGRRDQTARALETQSECRVRLAAWPLTL